ncbi:MAG: hypothetical protein K0R34_1161 [Herbinix sp.]|jgi:transcription initiation factor TFIIIB Brf1 subunit/transcription initiation factor TFIIB|nr:hypothetical protein [Herbinix sp.]
MPWCPNCNAEYQDGYTECSDCGVALVDNLEEKEVELVPFFQAEDKKMADKLVSYFKYSNLPSEVSYSEENEVYLVCIPPKMEIHAKKLYQAFYFVERENIENGMYKDNTEKSTVSDSSLSQEPSAELVEDEVDPFYSEEVVDDESIDLEDVIEEDEGVEKGAYVFKADRYKDLAGTVGIFLFFGVAGLIFVILNMAGILSLLNGWIPNLVMGALFISFLYVAISTKQKASKIRDEIDAENKLTEEINAWMKENVTQDYLASIHIDSGSEELNYIKMTDTIKERLLDKFGKQNLSYLDRLVEEYYNDNF